MNLDNTIPSPNLQMTAQRPIPDGGIPESVITMPEGLTNEQRGLVNEIMVLFRQYELDEFADPDRNTARNRLDRFVRVLHNLSFQIVKSVLEDEVVIKQIASQISENIEMSDYTQQGTETTILKTLTEIKTKIKNRVKIIETESDNTPGKKQEEKQEETKEPEQEKNQISISVIKEKIKDAISKKIKEGQEKIDKIKEMFKAGVFDSIKEEEKTLEEEKNNLRRKEKEEEEKFKGKPADKLLPKVKSGLKISGEQAKSAISKLMGIQNKIMGTGGKTRKLFTEIIKAKGIGAGLGKILDKTKKGLENISNIKVNNIAIKKLDKIKSDTEKVLKKVLGGNLLGKISGGIGSFLKGGAKIAGSVLGGILQGLLIGVAAIAGLVAAALKVFWGALKFVGNLTATVTKAIYKGVKFIIAEPIKMAGNLLKKNSFWTALGLFLTTPTGMYWLGFGVGRIIRMVEKYGILGTIWELTKKLFSLMSKALNWVWGEVGPFLTEFWEKTKENITTKWNAFLDNHPRIRAMTDFLGEVIDGISGIVKRVSDWVIGKVQAIRKWWDDKMDIVEKNYDSYVKRAEADQDKNIMSRDQFLAQIIHEDIAGGFNALMDTIYDVWKSIEPIVGFVRGIINWLTEHSWILTIVGILGKIMGQNLGNNEGSAAIMAILEGALGPIGKIVGQIISYMTEEVTLWAYNLFKRENAQMQSVTEVMQGIYGENFDFVKSKEKTSKKLSEMELSKFDNLQMSIDGNPIASAEEKKQHMLGLFQGFVNEMDAEMNRANEVSAAFSHLTLFSKGGKNMNYANNLQRIFSDTGILETHLLPFRFFDVPEIFGITPSDIYAAMDASGGGSGYEDGTSGNWRTAHLNWINRIGANLLRLKMYLISKIYGNVLKVMEKANETGDEDALWMLYNYLSPDGQFYKNIRASLMSTENSKALMEKLATEHNFDGTEGMNEFMRSISKKIDMASFNEMDKAVLQQAKLTRRSGAREFIDKKARATKYYVESAEKAHLQQLGDSLGATVDLIHGDVTTGNILQTAANATIVIPKLQAEAASITTEVTNTFGGGRAEMIRQEYIHYGGTDTGSIELGDVSDVASGNFLSKHLYTSDVQHAKKTKRFIEDLRAGRTNVENVDLAEDLYESFFQDLTAISNEFRRTSAHLDNSLKKLREKENITESDMIKAFVESQGSGEDGQYKLKPAQLEQLGKMAYQLYSQDKSQLDDMPEFFEKIGSGLYRLTSTDRQVLWDKYQGKTPEEILEEIVKGQMDADHFSEYQRQFMDNFYKFNFKEANMGVKQAILSHTMLNKSLSDQLQEKRKKLDELAAKKARME